MRRGSDGAAKRTREMAHRQTTLPSHLPERYTAFEIGTENFLGASHLPRRESAPDRPRQSPHAAIGLSNMDPDRQEHMFDEQLIRLVGMAKRRQHRPREVANRGVVETHGIVVQIA